MTTERQPRTRTSGSVLLGPVLVKAAAGGVVVLGVLGLAGAVAGGSAGALGALAGGGLALLVFTLGTGVVHIVSGLMPAASLLVALLTYTLQVALMALVLVGLDRSGVTGAELSRGWFAGAVIAVTVAWLATQLWQATHLRLPAYDLPSGDAGSRTEAGAR